MTVRSLICLHGYGVRGFFWDPVRTELEEAFPELLTPDLKMTNVETLLEHTERLVKSKAELDRAPLHLMGHSLGGVVAAVCARNLGPKYVSKVVVIGSPYGERPKLPGRLTQILMGLGIIPEIFIRSKFFSAQTPPEKQKELFSKSVSESRELQRDLLQPVWFHTDMFQFPLKQPSLAVYSRRDRIVSSEETKAFGEALGSELLEFGPNENVGHDDFIWAPRVSASLLPRIIGFLKQ